MLVDAGPGLELDSSPPGLASCGFNGELATNPDPGLGCGIGDGLMFVVKEVGDARLNVVAGLEPKLCDDMPPVAVCGLAGVCGFDPDGGVCGGWWKRRPVSRGPVGEGGRNWPKTINFLTIENIFIIIQLLRLTKLTNGPE